MITVQEHHDIQLRQRFLNLTENNNDYWSFKGNSRREHGHGLFQYPAMMVPQVVQSILDQVCIVHPEIERVCDPFSGSGTVMTESMMRGLAFSGTDINPLAILLCLVKSGPFFINSLKQKAEELIFRIDSDKCLVIEVDFFNRDKWFTNEVQIALSKIRRAIQHEKALWARRFFWIVLAETVRATSNSRTSTYKLHSRTNDDIIKRNNDTIGIFKKYLCRNILHYTKQTTQLSESGQLQHGHYKNDLNISLADIRHIDNLPKCDIIITSPPYGDNKTTVPYGQYSYLPLQWIDLFDIDKNIDISYLSTTHEIDKRSLGGNNRLFENDMNKISERSTSYRNYIKSLVGKPSDRSLRVNVFFRDLDASLTPILKNLNNGGLVVWTLGNRIVGGNRVPLDKILEELLFIHNTQMLCKLTRIISSKRMAQKNNITDTISNETILIMRKIK